MQLKSMEIVRAKIQIMKGPIAAMTNVGPIGK
jgi:hypothetical protein